MNRRVIVHGMYSTALAKLLEDSGYTVSGPTQEGDWSLPEKIVIRDRTDHQGIRAIGESEGLWLLLRGIQERLQDAVIVHIEAPDDLEGEMAAVIEFPGRAKEILDRARSFVTPTVKRHHQLSIVEPRRVKHAEADLEAHPERKQIIEAALYDEIILRPLSEAGEATIEHVRIYGRHVPSRKAKLVEVCSDRLVLKRTLSGGWYDGLDLPIEEGDFALTEVREGGWHLRHTYFTREGKYKGDYYNINTPVEFYPWGIRYVDLEVDVIRREGEAPFVVDRERLAILVKEGYIHPRLQQVALDIVGALIARISV